jgi:hypothetical protein
VLGENGARACIPRDRVWGSQPRFMVNVPSLQGMFSRCCAVGQGINHRQGSTFSASDRYPIAGVQHASTELGIDQAARSYGKLVWTWVWTDTTNTDCDGVMHAIN